MRDRATVVPVGLVLASCVSVQFGAAIATGLFPTGGAWGVTVLRLGIAALLLIVAVRPRILAWTRRQWTAVAALGVTLAGMNGAFYAAIDRIPLSAAVAIEFTGPLVLAAVLSRRRTDLIWVSVAAVGMVLLGVESVAGAHGLDPLGAVFALIAAAFWAGYILASARVGRDVPGTGGLAMALVVSTICVLPIGAMGAGRIVVDPWSFGLATATALLASVIPYSLELAALRQLPRNVFGVLLSLEPAVAGVVGWLVLGQDVSALRMGVIALVMIASAGITVTARGAPPRVRKSSASEDLVE